MALNLILVFIATLVAIVSGTSMCHAQLLPCLYLGPDGPTESQECLDSRKTGELEVTKSIVVQLTFDEKGLATVWEKERGWMYVNAKGLIIISGVAVLDNWADSFHDGLVRFSRTGKWGFADTTGKEIVPPVYDGSCNFDNGIARVCVGCRLEKESPDSEYHAWRGGQWACINTRGETVRCWQ